MADPPPAHSPATFPALETPQPVNVIHSEPASREEPQDPAAIPPPLAPLPDLVEAQLDTIMPDAVVGYAIICFMLTLINPSHL